jgi:predicted KAP-like P-loop ATPase
MPHLLNETVNLTESTDGKSTNMYADSMLTKWLQDHKPRAAAMKGQPAFFRNLEQAMDISRTDHTLFVAKPRWDGGGCAVAG